MNEPLISVVVPAYNAERFIDKCIKDVVDQTFSGWELIIVDDGSKDSTGDIADKWAKADARIRVVHKHNGGVSSARNAGINEAKGCYITFVDADDRIMPQYLDVLCSSIGDADMSIFPMIPVASEEEIPTLFETIVVKSSRYFLQEGYVVASERGLLHPPYCKCYKKEIIRSHNLRFDESIAMGEDLLFNLSYLEHCQEMVIGDNPIYYYIKGNSILSKTIRKDYADLQIEFYNRREDFCKRHNIDYSLAPFRYAILYDAFSSIAKAQNLSKKEKQDAIDSLSASKLAKDYLCLAKPSNIKELLFRMLIRINFLNKILL